MKYFKFRHAVILCLLLSAAVGAYTAGVVPAQIYYEQSMLVVLDAGHGGFDGGAVSEDGILEKELNLQVAKKLELILLQRSYTVVMTREGDYALQDEGESGKPADIKARRKIAEQYPDGVFVSIHMNKFPVAKYCGSQVFYSTNSELSGVLAGEIQRSIREGLQPDNERQTKPAGADIYLLHHLQMPSVVVECGFLSNPSEAAMLTGDEYQQSLAECIADGIDAYFYTKEVN